jgi:type VI secretion system protein ImpE
VTNPVTLFQSGDLSGALGMATDAVRSKPTDVRARSVLCELLCYSGELERAEKQLDAVLQSDPQTMNGVSLLKHLIRSELSRREVYRQGRVPDFVAMPTEPQKKRLEAVLCLRTGHTEDARRLCDEATELDPELSGQLNDQPFVGIRDLDDLLGPTLEVFTATGKYYWIGFEQITSLEFNPVEHLTDMLWRSATIETVGDVSGRIHVPALYEGSETSGDQRIRIGRATEWLQSTSTAPVRGIGQREFLVGEDVVSIMEIRRLTFQGINVA